jgi:lycopene cyclase domain-containing protein
LIHAYTFGALISMLLSIAVDLWILKTKLVTTARFWVSLVIVDFFQIFVDGWLTKLSAPIVIYNPSHFLGVRVFFSTPIEDFVYGFSIVLLTLALWAYIGRREETKEKYTSRSQLQ